MALSQAAAEALLASAKEGHNTCESPGHDRCRFGLVLTMNLYANICSHAHQRISAYLRGISYRRITCSFLTAPLFQGFLVLACVCSFHLLTFFSRPLFRDRMTK